MPESEFVTQCPKCGTTFRVTETQLAAAHGAVRCGACLQVFAANDHLIEAEMSFVEPQLEIAQIDEDEQAAGPESELENGAERGMPYGPDTGETISSADDFLDNDTVDSQITHENNKDESSAFNEQISGELNPGTEPGTREVYSDETDPNETALEVLSEELDGRLDAPVIGEVDREITSGLEELEELEELEDKENDQVFVLDDVLEATGQIEQVANQGTSELDQTEYAQREYGEPELADSSSESRADEEETDDLSADGWAVSHAFPDEKNDALSFVPDFKLESEEAEEIVGSYQPPKSTYVLRWFLGALLLTVVLCAQFAYVNIQSLEQNPELRPYFGLFCNYADCKLQAFDDVSSIETTELVVRVHPQIERALLVDAIIRNTSAYKQTFPALEMKFTDLNNLVIATRLFLPKEYLGGEMAGLSFIPARTEVRLGLEIVDPGEKCIWLFARSRFATISKELTVLFPVPIPGTYSRVSVD